VLYIPLVVDQSTMFVCVMQYTNMLKHGVITPWSRQNEFLIQHSSFISWKPAVILDLGEMCKLRFYFLSAVNTWLHIFINRGSNLIKIRFLIGPVVSYDIAKSGAIRDRILIRLYKLDLWRNMYSVFICCVLVFYFCQRWIHYRYHTNSYLNENKHPRFLNWNP
jgi:hypothetical protein